MIQKIFSLRFDLFPTHSSKNVISGQCIVFVFSDISLFGHNLDFFVKFWNKCFILQFKIFFNGIYPFKCLTHKKVYLQIWVNFRKSAFGAKREFLSISNENDLQNLKR